MFHEHVFYFDGAVTGGTGHWIKTWYALLSGSAAAMSRRRISVKELGVVDCQGWLFRRKEGRSFLGSKWKRYWFVLKKSSLYWYADKMVRHGPAHALGLSSDV